MNRYDFLMKMKASWDSNDYVWVRGLLCRLWKIYFCCRLTFLFSNFKYCHSLNRVFNRVNSKLNPKVNNTSDQHLVPRTAKDVTPLSQIRYTLPNLPHVVLSLNDLYALHSLKVVGGYSSTPSIARVLKANQWLNSPCLSMDGILQPLTNP
jgi:hypothetical protein